MPMVSGFHLYKQRKNTEKNPTQVKNCSFLDSFTKGDGIWKLCMTWHCRIAKKSLFVL